MTRQELLIAGCAVTVMVTQIACTAWIGRTVWRASPDEHDYSRDLADMRQLLEKTAKDVEYVSKMQSIEAEESLRRNMLR